MLYVDRSLNSVLYFSFLESCVLSDHCDVVPEIVVTLPENCRSNVDNFTDTKANKTHTGKVWHSGIVAWYKMWNKHICVKFLLKLPTFGLQMIRFRKRYIPSSIFFFHLGPCNSTIIIPFLCCHWIRGPNSPMIRWHQDMGLKPDTSICGLRMLCSYRIRYQPWFNNWPHYRGLAIPTCIMCRDAFRDR